MTSRSDDWVFVAVVLAIAYLLIYPIYVIYLRLSKSRRIKNQLVTSEYKLPTKLSPTDLSYLFSPSIKQRHLYATLLDLANRSIIVLKEKEGKVYAESGPKIENDLTEQEKIFTNHILATDHAVLVERLISGLTVYKNNNHKVNGTKAYVFWWLLRKSLRQRGIIEKQMTGRYTKILLSFGVLSSLLVSLVSITILRIFQMFDRGEVDFGMLAEHWMNALVVWLIMLVPIIIVSFGVLRFRAKLLGRHWLMTKKYRRYMNQIIAYKEFVRLTHKKKLKFESRELEKESRVKTKPYAIALGFIDGLPGK